jgi:ArsR family transcriptional regulator, lead/cadmium/zinc/bismuth-responsive transcriptional repressor
VVRGAARGRRAGGDAARERAGSPLRLSRNGDTIPMLKRTANHEERLPEDAVHELAEVFRLMSDPSRLRIILTCLTEPVSVGDMANRLNLTPSLVSHHLRLLRAARLLTADRQGRQVFYQVTDEHVRRMLGNMVDHVAEDYDLEVE